MEKKVRLILLVGIMSLLLLHPLYAQEIRIVRPGLLRAQLTLSPSYLLRVKEPVFYLHGNFEGYVHDHYSLAGEVFYYLGSLADNEPTFKFHHSVLFGASWHLVRKQSDFYIGLQPGLSITRLNETDSLKTSIGVNPLFSPVIGYNLYVNRYLHFFLQTRFVFGKHTFDEVINQSEFRFSGGLGFNINAIRRKE